MSQIELLYDRPHNIPELPTALRVLNGFVVGNFARLTEPFWWVTDPLQAARYCVVD